MFQYLSVQAQLVLQKAASDTAAFGASATLGTGSKLLHRYCQSLARPMSAFGKTPSRAVRPTCGRVPSVRAATFSRLIFWRPQGFGATNSFIKNGITGGKVEARIANPALDVTYLWGTWRLSPLTSAPPISTSAEQPKSHSARRRELISTCAGLLSAHSQTVATRHPSSRRVLRTAPSRTTFASNFACQNPWRLAGLVA